MLVCEICGESKYDEEFYLIRWFYKYMKEEIQWCRDCQKMYRDMKRKEGMKRELEEKHCLYVLEFK
jgi:ribosome-binding protein aMBF1 (putative translation factor)